MKIKEMVIDQIYYMYCAGDYSFCYRHLQGTIIKGEYIQDGKFFNNVISGIVENSDRSLSDNKVRLATEDEASHFRQCLEAKRYVQYKKPALENSYLIF